MLERNQQFKTKLCFEYQRGRCSRHNCNYAHGAAELRRYSGSVRARREYRSSDLRNRLDRKCSTQDRFSPEKDVRGQGYRPSESPNKIDRKRRRERQWDGCSDFSRSLRNSRGIEGPTRQDKLAPSSPKDDHEEQLRQVHIDINILEERRSQLEVNLEEKFQEEDSLISRIQELESQLEMEKEECKRITLKIKKFVKAHNRCSRLKSELTRSQARLQKLGDQLGSDTARIGDNDEDSDVNIISDGEAPGHLAINYENEFNNDASPGKKSPRGNMEIARQPNENGNLPLGKYPINNISVENHPWGSTNLYQSNDYNKVEVVNNETSVSGASAKASKNNRDGTLLASNLLMRKQKVMEPKVPSTSIAGNTVDEVVEIVLEDRVGEFQTDYNGIEKEATHETKELPFMPPPHLPIIRNNYSQYEGNDENVNVDGFQEETADVDID